LPGTLRGLSVRTTPERTLAYQLRICVCEYGVVVSSRLRQTKEHQTNYN
jgi:hypothetical protein